MGVIEIDDMVDWKHQSMGNGPKVLVFIIFDLWNKCNI
jgi:hypothetical protein